MYIFMYFAHIVPVTAPSKVCTRRHFIATPSIVRLTGRPIYRSACHHVLQLLISPLLIAMALNSLDDSQKRNIAAFFPSPKERGWDINPVEEKQLFSARGGWVLLPSTRSLLEGSFVWGWILRLIACIGVVVKLSRGDLSLWCQWWPCLQPVILRNRTLVCECTDGHKSELSFSCGS